jgi:hypoxanthine phosphoribosyltransferase
MITFSQYVKLILSTYVAVTQIISLDVVSWRKTKERDQEEK